MTGRRAGKALEWRVVAGPNLGAALALGPGRWVVGSGDEADVILADDSLPPAHLELDVSADGDGALAARAVPLEGAARLDGEPVPKEGLPVGPGQALALGLTALAYRESGADWAGMELVPLAYARALALAEAPAGPQAGAPGGPGLGGPGRPTRVL
jgi:hypothetical protein